MYCAVVHPALLYTRPYLSRFFSLAPAQPNTSTSGGGREVLNLVSIWSNCSSVGSLMTHRHSSSVMSGVLSTTWVMFLSSLSQLVLVERMAGPGCCLMMLNDLAWSRWAEVEEGRRHRRDCPTRLNTSRLPRIVHRGSSELM